MLWHPKAQRINFGGIGGFTAGGKKLVWHTVEGSSIEGAVAAYRASGSYPHFTLQWKDGKLLIAQHAPIDQCVTTLQHPGGTPETNRAGCIQVEIASFAKDAHNWPDEMYAALADFARWVEDNAGVPRKTGVKFTVPAQRLSGSAFVSYAGHIGHCHVPGNDHWDPGAFKIEKVLGAGELPKRDYASRVLKVGARGTDVRELQRQVNRHRRYRRKHGISKRRNITVDGEYGPKTEKAVRRTAWNLGAPTELLDNAGTSKDEQRYIRHPKQRPQTWRRRQQERRSS